MRDFRLFAILDDDKDARLKVSAIHDEAGYRRVREILSDNYNLGSREPNLQVWDVDLRGDRSLTLRHQAYLRRPLSGDCQEVLKHVAHLWGFAVRLEVAQEDGSVLPARMPPRAPRHDAPRLNRLDTPSSLRRPPAPGGD
jgi:spore cortex formation protein SpoVR/YcgB (stage V sporulation)